MRLSDSERTILDPDADLVGVVDHIEATHHAFLKEALPRLRELGTEVIQAHGARHATTWVLIS